MGKTQNLTKLQALHRNISESIHRQLDQTLLQDLVTVIEDYAHGTSQDVTNALEFIETTEIELAFMHANMPGFIVFYHRNWPLIEICLGTSRTLCFCGHFWTLARHWITGTWEKVPNILKKFDDNRGLWCKVMRAIFIDSWACTEINLINLF